MAESEEKIRTLGPGTLMIGETASQQKFDADTTNVKLKPDVSTSDPTTFLDGHEESGEATVTWKMTGSITEDFSAGGVQAFCIKNMGKSLPFTFKPNKNAALSATGKVKIVPLAIGGDVKTQNSQDFEFEATDVAFDWGESA